MEYKEKKVLVASRESCEQIHPDSNSKIYHLPKLTHLISFIIKNKQKPPHTKEVFKKVMYAICMVPVHMSSGVVTYYGIQQPLVTRSV